MFQTVLQTAVYAVKSFTVSQMLAFVLVAGVLTLLGMLVRGRGIQISLVPTKPPSGSSRRRRRKASKAKSQAREREPQK